MSSSLIIILRVGDINRSQHCHFVSEFGYLAAFSNVGGSKLSDVLNGAKFRDITSYNAFAENLLRVANLREYVQN